jgi:uncharacterized protein (DUF433 family)
MQNFDRITWNPNQMNGQPCIRDMRLTVRRVLEAIAVYPNRDDLFRDYPELEPEDVRQALEFAAANLEDTATESNASAMRLVLDQAFREMPRSTCTGSGTMARACWSATWAAAPATSASIRVKPRAIRAGSLAITVNRPSPLCPNLRLPGGGDRELPGPGRDVSL